MTAAVAAQTQFANKAREWQVFRAPEPNAVNWNSLSIPNWQLPLRHAITILGSVALTLFWIIPVTAIMALTNLSNLAAIKIGESRPFSFLDNVAQWSNGALGVIEGLLPAIILSVFLGLIPTFLRMLINLSRVGSSATVDLLVRDWYFNFVVFSNFLFVAFAGTLLDDLQKLIKEPTKIVDLLAGAIPKQGAFIMNFVLLKALSESPQQLMQIGRVAVRWVMLRFFARTTREKNNVDMGNTVFVYITNYAIAQLIALLGMIYSTIQPFINVVVLAFFAINYIVWKYNLCFSMHNPYQDGGRMFGGALYGLWAGLFLHQLTMIGLFGLNRSPAQAILIVIPAILSILFLRYCRVSFDRIIEHGSALETQRLVDDENEADVIDESLAMKFIHPGFEPLPDPVENLNGVDGNDGGQKQVDFDDLENPTAPSGEMQNIEERANQPKSMSSEDWKDAHSSEKGPGDDAPL